MAKKATSAEDEYWKNAADTLDPAHRASSSADKERLLVLAEKWLQVVEVLGERQLGEGELVLDRARVFLADLGVEQIADDALGLMLSFDSGGHHSSKAAFMPKSLSSPMRSKSWTVPSDGPPGVIFLHRADCVLAVESGT